MVETHLKNNYIDWLPVKNGEALLCVSENLDNLEGMWNYIVISDAFVRVPALFEGKTPYRKFFDFFKNVSNLFASHFNFPPFNKLIVCAEP